MDLYQELILEHAKRPLHAGLREPYDAEVSAVNPTCGDGVTLRVAIARAGHGSTIRDVSYEVQGCSISTAATSVMADSVIGADIGSAMTTYAAMRSMLGSRGADPGDPQVLGDGIALAGVAKYPARVKCALLGWFALTDALVRAGIDPDELDLARGPGPEKKHHQNHHQQPAQPDARYAPGVKETS